MPASVEGRCYGPSTATVVDVIIEFIVHRGDVVLAPPQFAQVLRVSVMTGLTCGQVAAK